MRSRDGCEEEMPRFGTVNMSDPAERARWAEAFGVSEMVLEQAVRIVGTSVGELRKLFCRD